MDWTVSADGYRLVIEGGLIVGLAYDEWPWPWGDSRYGLYETVREGVLIHQPGSFIDDDDGDDYFEQSTTACCPRQTIPDSCSCLEDCECMCVDCICDHWGERGQAAGGAE